MSDPGYIHGPKVIPGVWQVRVNWALTDGKAAHINVYGSHPGTGSPTSAMCDTIRSSITTGGLWTGLATMLATTTVLQSVSILDLGNATNAFVNGTTGSSPGTAAGAALPDEVAFVITLGSAQRGPGGRGRVYLPGFATQALGAGGVVTATAVTNAQAWVAQALGPAVIASVGPWVLAQPARNGYTSPATGRVFPARPAGSVPVLSAVARDNHWDSQRRRGLR